MMRRLAPLVLPLLGTLAGAVLYLQLRKSNDGLAPQATEPESSQSTVHPPIPVVEGAPTQSPRLALALLNSSLNAGALAAAGEKESSANRAETDRFFAEERRIMAKTWGLTEEQSADFEISIYDVTQERQGAFDRVTRDRLTPMELAARLRAADERASQRLLDALGPEHLLEYQLMNGHFVEAGLDHKQFVPPTVDPAAPTRVGQSASIGPESQAATPTAL